MSKLSSEPSPLTVKLLLLCCCSVRCSVVLTYTYRFLSGSAACWLGCLAR